MIYCETPISKAQLPNNLNNLKVTIGSHEVICDVAELVS